MSRTSSRVRRSVAEQFYCTWESRSPLRKIAIAAYDQTVVAGWEGLLIAQPDQRVFLYGMPFAEFSIAVRKVDSGGFTASACIHTVDDGPGVFWGPTETHRKACARAAVMVEAAERWGGWNPTSTQVEEFRQATGTEFQIC